VGERDEVCGGVDIAAAQRAALHELRQDVENGEGAYSDRDAHSDWGESGGGAAAIRTRNGRAGARTDAGPEQRGGAKATATATAATIVVVEDAAKGGTDEFLFADDYVE
jgi:hypothetical protein